MYRDSGCDLAQDPHLGQGEGAGLGNNEGLGPLQLGNGVGGVGEMEGDEEEAGRVVDLTGVEGKGGDCQGLQNPHGLRVGYIGVGVRVGPH